MTTNTTLDFVATISMSGLFNGVADRIKKQLYTEADCPGGALSYNVHHNESLAQLAVSIAGGFVDAYPRHFNRNLFLHRCGFVYDDLLGKWSTKLQLAYNGYKPELIDHLVAETKQLAQQ